MGDDLAGEISDRSWILGPLGSGQTIDEARQCAPRADEERVQRRRGRFAPSPINAARVQDSFAQR